MAEQTIGITASQLQEILKAAIGESNKMNPIEQRKFNEEVAKEKRKDEMAASLAKIEEQSRINKQNACSHTRDDQGNAAPKGKGVWTTSGQVHGNDHITIICQRCSTTWRFKSTPQEREYAQNATHGLLGFAPPDQSRLVEV